MDQCKTKQRLSILLLPYICFYAVQAIYSTYFNLYLNDVGFSKTQMGVITSATTLAVMLVQPCLGIISDRAKSKNSVVIMLLAFSAMAILGFYASTAYLFVLAVACVYAMCNTPTTPLLDNIALESLERTNDTRFNFGHMRIGGTLGYCIGALLSNAVFQDHYNRMFVMIAFFLLLALAGMRFVPSVQGVPNEKHKDKFPVRQLLGNRRILGLLLLVISFQLGSYNYHAFYPIYFRTIDGNSSLIGIMMFMSALSEIPMWLLCNRLIDKFGVQRMAVTACLLTALRWLVLFLTTSTALVFLINLTHGVGFVILNYSLVVLINEQIPVSRHATGQSLASTIVTICSRIVGGVLCGWMCDLWGVRSMMLFNLVITLASMTLFVWMQTSFPQRDERKTIT